MGELQQDMDTDSASDIYPEYRQAHNHRNASAAVHFIICCLCVCEAEIQGKECALPRLCRHNSCSLAGIHGSAVHDAQEHGA